MKLISILLFACGLIIGILIGVMLQQGIYSQQISKIASNLDGVEIDINLNETKLVDGFRNVIDSIDFNNTFNNTEK